MSKSNAMIRATLEKQEKLNALIAKKKMLLHLLVLEIFMTLGYSYYIVHIYLEFKVLLVDMVS